VIGRVVLPHSPNNNWFDSDSFDNVDVVLNPKTYEPTYYNKDYNLKENRYNYNSKRYKPTKEVTKQIFEKFKKDVNYIQCGGD